MQTVEIEVTPSPVLGLLRNIHVKTQNAQAPNLPENTWVISTIFLVIRQLRVLVWFSVNLISGVPATNIVQF